MSLVVKFWLGFAMVLSGFALTVILTDTRTRTDERFLMRIDSALIPASHAAQEALALYRQLQQTLQDGVVFGDEPALLRSRDLTKNFLEKLGTISDHQSLPSPLRLAANAISEEVRVHIDTAIPLYLRLLHSEKGDDLVTAAALSTKQSEEILSHLTRLQADVRQELTTSIADRITSGKHERLISEILLFTILLTGSIGLAVLIRNLSTRLALLVAASGKLASGDYETNIGVGGRDEIGRLADIFEVMRAAIAGRNRELKDLNRDLDQMVNKRTAQLEDRNRQLSVEITDRKRTENAFRLVEAALGQMDEGVVITEAEGLLDHPPEYVNPGFFGVLGLPREGGFELALHTIFELHAIPPSLIEAFHDARNGQTRVSEILFVPFGQPERVIEWMVSPIRSETGDITHIIAIIRDLTEQRLAEAQRQQGMKLESIGQLAAGVAHEINTPIQFIGDNLKFLSDSFGDIHKAIAAYSVILEHGRTSGTIEPSLLASTDDILRTTDLAYVLDEAPKAVNQSQDGVVRVSDIVRAMKEFSHPDDGGRKAVNINQSILTTLTVARNEYKYVAEVVTDLAEDLPPIPCFVGEFNQVVLNLVINAAHAIGDVVAQSGNKGIITVSSRLEGESVEIRISDTGTGIPEAARARIFDPFFTTKSVGKGTGQGLFIARTVIVKKHHGSLDFETEIGGGTTFIIRLPLIC